MHSANEYSSKEFYKFHRRESNREAKRRSRLREKSKLEQANDEIHRLKRVNQSLREEIRWTNARSIADFRSRLSNVLLKQIHTASNPLISSEHMSDAALCMHLIALEEVAAVGRTLKDCPKTLRSLADSVGALHIVQHLVCLLNDPAASVETPSAHALLERLALDGAQAAALTAMAQSTSSNADAITNVVGQIAALSTKVSDLAKEFEDRMKWQIEEIHKCGESALRPSQRAIFYGLMGGSVDRRLYEYYLGADIADRIIVQMSADQSGDDSACPSTNEEVPEGNLWRDITGLPLFFSRLQLPLSLITPPPPQGHQTDTSNNAFENPAPNSSCRISVKGLASALLFPSLTTTTEEKQAEESFVPSSRHRRASPYKCSASESDGNTSLHSFQHDDNSSANAAAVAACAAAIIIPRSNSSDGNVTTTLLRGKSPTLLNRRANSLPSKSLSLSSGSSSPTSVSSVADQIAPMTIMPNFHANHHQPPLLAHDNNTAPVPPICSAAAPIRIPRPAPSAPSAVSLMDDTFLHNIIFSTDSWMCMGPATDPLPLPTLPASDPVDTWPNLHPMINWDKL